MWFWLSIIACICWSGSDLFSKIGCSDQKDKHSPLRMVVAVGFVMGIHALYEIIFNKVAFTLETALKYLPVSLLYIGSMTLGYLGLKYIELSISSPICNSSGALVSVLCLAFGLSGALNFWQTAAIVLIAAGVIGLGVVEATEDEELRVARQSKSNKKYSKSILALALPLAYCSLDALGSFADSLVLADPETSEISPPEILRSLMLGLNEDSANVAYELTFFVAGLGCFIYLLLKKDLQSAKKASPRFLGGIFETAGQFAYIYALADTRHVAFSAPIISSYCVLSVIWSRIFLKERLSYKHYFAIFTVAAGIIILGMFDA